MACSGAGDDLLSLLRVWDLLPQHTSQAVKSLDIWQHMLQMWGGSLAAAAAGISLLLLVFGDRLPWARRQRKGGRWVADRALGGREVSTHSVMARSVCLADTPGSGDCCRGCCHDAAAGLAGSGAYVHPTHRASGAGSAVCMQLQPQAVLGLPESLGAVRLRHLPENSPTSSMRAAGSWHSWSAKRAGTTSMYRPLQPSQHSHVGQKCSVCQHSVCLTWLGAGVDPRC